MRLARRLQRDTQERGHSFDEVIAQYHNTVRPMHDEWVEPSKKVADIIVHSYHHSIDVAVDMLTTHLRHKAAT